VVFGDGSASRDFCFVDNVVQANLLAACATAPEAAGGVFNIAYGQRTTLLQLFSAIRQRVAAIRPVAPDQRSPEFAPPRPGDIPHSLADIQLARDVLGYQPMYDLGHGLDRTVPWYGKRASAPVSVVPSGALDGAYSQQETP
jgi:UDP-N-acetylglucosamine 4-epimerase